ncbi:MAG: dihydroxyacetone kinase subunit DhaK [Oscillospiraceae bacterium]|nr:dihydroxyacetone kinase subunit DhaK [Oscillospiraceae bacterium]
MKKIINDPSRVVYDMLAGLTLVNGGLALDNKYKVISKGALDRSKVTLISGGGSGHEPAHAGFVGKGLLDAAVCGDVFASPSQIQVYQAIKETASGKGTLLIIKNYSGDMMNFTNAMHMAREDGLQVDYVRVDDDVAVEDSLYTVGRRGVAGTIFVHKIAGAAAEAGYSLAEVKRAAEKVVANVRSLGFALTSCTVPAKGSPTFELGEDEMEYGVGIHGEPGIRREPIAGAAALAGRMAAQICGELGFAPGGAAGTADGAGAAGAGGTGAAGGAAEASGAQRAAVLINGFGATPLMELYALANDVIRELSGRGVVIARALVGNYMTSIDMAGASVSVLKLDNELEELLNKPCDSPGLVITGPVGDVEYRDLTGAGAMRGDVSYEVETAVGAAQIGGEITLDNIVYIIDVMSHSIIKNEIPFCELDSHAGDGDFGSSVAKGFMQLKTEWKALVSTPGLTISNFLAACSMIIMEHCGGASGPIWGSAFRAAGKSAAGKSTLAIGDFAAMLQAAVEGIQAIGERSFGRGAVVGDKTLIDAFAPCADVWKACADNGEGFGAAFKKGAAAAVEGAKKTEGIVARMGRAGALGERSLGHPDAGAHALGVIFTDIANTLKF